MTVKFEIENTDEIERKLDEWQKKFGSPNTILSEFGEREVKRVQKRFKNEQDPDGNSWRPWDPEYMEQRVLEGTSSFGMLVSSGMLYNSIYYQVSGNKVIVGTDVHYGRFIQEGTENMPARPFLGFNDRSRDDLAWLVNTAFDK